MIGTIASDPVFQIGIFGIVVGTIALFLALRSQVGTHPQAVAHGTRLVLGLGVLGLAVLSGWSSWHALVETAHPASSAVSASSSPTVEPTPTPSPTPTATPTLSRSITQVLTAFCQAINEQDYQTAWDLYAQSLQSKHPRATVVAAWQQFEHCRIADQAYDPDALMLLVLTLAPGVTDQYGFTGETTERFTMGIEAQEWKIVSVCHLIAEGCYALKWG